MHLRLCSNASLGNTVFVCGAMLSVVYILYTHSACVCVLSSDCSGFLFSGLSS